MPAAKDLDLAVDEAPDEPQVKGPVPLDPNLLRHVSGGGPKGTWEDSEPQATVNDTTDH